MESFLGNPELFAQIILPHICSGSLYILANISLVCSIFHKKLRVVLSKTKFRILLSKKRLYFDLRKSLFFVKIIVDYDIYDTRYFLALAEIEIYLRETYNGLKTYDSNAKPYLDMVRCLRNKDALTKKIENMCNFIKNEYARRYIYNYNLTLHK
jgi:hypothetical protein